ncbi:MAG: hypothetical protein LLG04_08990 [Parachlamydia sp.]|nr:hypothetical protein [Parachlamydia sp.]
MDFTREPIIETVITPREGCKLVVRSSKSAGQEEYFVDAVEVVTFGHSLFFRSLERPKAFLVPVSDYEILEVREARMVLKNVGVERSIKIGGGREAAPPRLPKEVPAEVPSEEIPVGEEAPLVESRLEKKRGRRHYRRRRGREEPGAKEGESQETSIPSEDIGVKDEFKEEIVSSLESEETPIEVPPSLILSSILPPPPTLISETIARYKDNAMFKGAFFVREEQGEKESDQQGEQEPQKEPYKEAWISDEAEEEIFRHRAASMTEEESLPGISGETPESAETKEGQIPNSN